MRQVGDIVGLERANRFLNFLTKQGIEAEVREHEAETYRIWIIDEDQLENAESWLQAYLQNPAAPRFDAPEPKSKTPSAGSNPKSIVIEDESQGIGQATLAFLIISVALTFLRDVPGSEHFLTKLFFSERFERGFPEILSGEIWRLITPIFLHRDWLHLIFNMLWLFQLGGAIERNEGSLYLSFTLLLTGSLCNIAQYLVSGPAFMGMSGVVYAMLGYIWMMGKYQPATRYALPQQTIGFMLLWLFICLIGLIPNVANTQHIVGLVLGMSWGFIRSGRPGALRRRARFKHSQR